MFDRLQRGEDYAESGCAIHIGILDFTLFEEVPEFYACYKMLNVKNHHVFNEKFVLNVLDLRLEIFIPQLVVVGRVLQDAWGHLLRLYI